MKTLLLLGAIFLILDAAIVPISAQTARASPAATVSPRPTPGRASPTPRATLTARPHATGSPVTSGAATSSPLPARGPDTRGTPAATASPGGGAQLEGESTTARQSPPPAATSAETPKPTPLRPHRKLERREGNTPQEGPGNSDRESDLHSRFHKQSGLRA